MKDSSQDPLKEEFETQKKDWHIDSGCVKFSSDYVSWFDLFKAVKKWTKEDPNVIYAAIRGGGTMQIAVDFRYDQATLPKDKRDSKFAHKVLKPFFEKELGGDFIDGWDHGSAVTVV